MNKFRPGHGMGIIAIAAIVVLLLPSGTRTATPPNLPPADVNETITSWNSRCNASHSGAGSVTGGCTPTGTADITASATYAGGSGTVTVYQRAYSKREQASASVTWYFEVLGPADTRVPLVFYATGATSQAQSPTGGSYAFASAAITTGDRNTTLYKAGACSHGVANCGGNPATANLPNAFSVQQSFTVSSNTVYAIVLNAVGYSNSGAFSTAVDPSVTFDPAFRSGRYRYTLVFSADASPASR
jgi:hypothetical protein